MAGHEGHRDRLKKRFLIQGLEGFDDHTVLELILMFAVARKDTNMLAHNLIERFGSFDQVLEASTEDLMQVPGVGEHAAALLRLIPAAGKRYLMLKESTGEILADSNAIGRYLVPRFMNLHKECVMLLCLDSKFKVLYCGVISTGSLTSASFRIREVVECCLRFDTKYAVLAHNHVGGIALPSREDIVSTQNVFEALGMVDIRLLDHIIVAGRDFVSLKDDKLL